MKRAWAAGLLAGAAVGLTLFSLGSVLHAQGRSDPHRCVAVVDVGKIFNEYDRMKTAQDELKQLEDRLQLENEQRKQKTDMLEATVSKMDPADPTYTRKMNEVLESRIGHKTWFELQQANATREIAVATDRIYRDITGAAEQVARESGFSLVLYREPYEPLGTNPEEIQAQMRARKVLYASENIDITQFVLDRLNSSYRSKPPAPEIQVP